MLGVGSGQWQGEGGSSGSPLGLRSHLCSTTVLCACHDGGRGQGMHGMSWIEEWAYLGGWLDGGQDRWSSGPVMGEQR